MLKKLTCQLPKDSTAINKIREAIPDDYKTVFYPHLKIACYPPLIPKPPLLAAFYCSYPPNILRHINQHS
ncbi:hypothetical protein CC797_18135 [Salmonella enterica subsp. enterica]|nr:hypothetical protein [Salmonella enterica subsp. enterica serovar Paratyphi C]